MTSHTRVKNANVTFLGSKGDFPHSLTYVANDLRTSQGCPDWRLRILRMQNATTPFTATRNRVVVASPIDQHIRWYDSLNRPWYYHDDGHWAAACYGLGFAPFVDTGTLTQARNKAKASFVRKAKAHQHEFAGGVFLGELGETLGMVGTTAEKLWRLLNQLLDDYRAIRHLRFSRRGRISYERLISDLWLEFSFGWKPLAADVQDALTALKNKAEGRKSSYIHAVGDFTDGVVNQQITENTAYTLLPVNGSVTTQYEAKVIMRGVVLHDLPNNRSDISKFLQHFGLDLPSFVPTMWELVPWSFLVDYFTNIGMILECSMFARSSLVWSCQTERTTALRRTSIQTSSEQAARRFCPGWKKTKSFSSGGGHLVVEQTKVARAPIVSLIPTLEFHIPGHPVQWLNMIALAITHSRCF